MRSPCRIAVVLAAAACISVAVRAQAPDPRPAAFEVASIKPNPSRDAPESVSLQAGGGVRMTGFRLNTLIRVAFSTGTTLTPDRVIGGPAWINADRFDIVAKADGDLMFDVEGRRPARVIAMLKTLIEDRFKVKVHTETRKLAAYALTLARRDRRLGPQLQETKTECPKYAGGRAPANADPDRWCGFRRAPGSVTARSVTMPEVAAFFSGFAVVSRPVVDHTGLTGRYDLRVQFIEGPDADNGSLFTALNEQLGLAFHSERATLPVLVIDHAERPTPD